MLVGVLAVLIGAGGFVGGLLAAPVDFQRALPPPPRSALLLAADGTQLATIRPPERREVVPAGDIPEVMRQAIISAEDERFLQHKGVDPLATIRAAYRDLTGSRLQGGSTLTQQYVKNVYVDNQRTALRKIREAALAVRLEQRLSKQQILTDYLNVLYLGNGTYGVQAASKYYFGVPVKDLDLSVATGVRTATLAIARAAMLAGMAPAPSVWNPVHDFPTSKARQRYTLNQMVKGGYITSRQASDAFLRGVTPVKLSPPDPPTIAPEFVDLVKAQIKDQYKGDKEEQFFRGGLRIRTTLDEDLQAAAARAANEVLPDATDPEAAVVAIDITNGDVKAMTTLRRAPAHKDPHGVTVPEIAGYKRDGLNLAAASYHSTGSTIKPFTLAVALKEGHSLDETRTVPNCIVVVSNPPYRPCNAEKFEAGTFSLRRALANSINTVYIPLAIEVGRAKIRDLMLAAGVKPSPVTPFSTAFASFGLGSTAEVTPLSLADAYATLANHGIHTVPRFVTEVRTGAEGTSQGHVQSTGKVVSNRVLDAGVADQVDTAMRDVVTYGTGTAAEQPFPVFGKTGTTDKATNAWFIGCAQAPQNLCLAVWMGYYDNRPMHDLHGVTGDVFGGTLPARIFARTFEILREIQAAKAAAAKGTPSPTAAPPATLPPAVRRPRPSPTPTPVPSRTATPTPTPTPSPHPTPPAPSRTSLLPPPRQPSPGPSPS